VAALAFQIWKGGGGLLTLLHSIVLVNLTIHSRFEAHVLLDLGVAIAI
jgi:hypothetical protein